MFVGRLVVLTELMQWTFEVRGTHASYSAPVVTESRISNRLKKQTQKAMNVRSKKKQTNLVKANILEVGR